MLRESPPIPEAPAGDFSADQQPLPQTARLAGVQTADPDGGIPWGVRVFSNVAENTAPSRAACSTANWAASPTARSVNSRCAGPVSARTSTANSEATPSD